MPLFLGGGGGDKRVKYKARKPEEKKEKGKAENNRVEVKGLETQPGKSNFDD